MRVLWKGKSLKGTISIGVADNRHHTGQLSTLVAAADTALYRAKAQGRNRVLVQAADNSAAAVGAEAGAAI